MKPLANISIYRIYLSAMSLCLILLIYVKLSWPAPVLESDIPPGKVEIMFGNELGILCQGTRSGPQLWYHVERRHK